MNFWQFLDRRLSAMTIRVWLTIGLYVMAWHALDLIHGREQFAKLEELLVQALVIQGFLGLILAFYFAANTSDESKTENTGKLADAFRTVAESSASAPPAPPTTADVTGTVELTPREGTSD